MAVADAVRARLAEDGDTQSRAVTAERLGSLGVGVGFTLRSLRERIEAAEQAQKDLDVERSIEILESVLADLQSDGDFTAAKQELHEQARLRAATRLLALAGPDEDGSAKTPRGERALAHLRAAVRVNPTLTLSEKRYPPRLRRLLERAKRDLQAAGLGGLSVDSTPPGATVYVEGRPVGLTPLRLLEQLPRGRYRVWLEHEGAKSATRRLQVTEQPATLEVNLAFEGALWAGGPGLRPIPGESLDGDVVAKAGSLVDASDVVVAGVQDGVAFAARVGSDGAVRARAAAPLAGAALPDTAAALVERLASGPREGDPEIPARVLPAGGVHAAGSASAAQAADEDDGALWWWIAGGAGAVTAVVATAAVVGGLAWAAATPPVGRFGVEVVE